MASPNAATQFAQQKVTPAPWVRLLFPFTLLFITVLLLLQASTVLMWYDEIATYEPADLPQASKTLEFFTEGYDTPSPIPSLLMHESMHLIGDTDLNDRLIFLAFFLITCSFIYAFVKRRYPEAYSLAAILFLAGIPAREYGITMRAYVFLLCGAAGMMYFWQRAVFERRTWLQLTGLWCSFAFAALSHVFAVFLFVPFALAELVRTGFSVKKADKAIWAVLLTAPVTLLSQAPSILEANKRYGPGFSGRPTLMSLFGSYGAPLGVPGFILIALLLGAALLGRRLFARAAEPATAPERRGFLGPEWALIAGLLAIPVVGVAGALVLGPFNTRYVLPVVFGMALGLAGLLATICNFNPKAGFLLVGLLLIYDVAAQHRALALARHGHIGTRLIQDVQAQPWIKDICASDLLVLGASPFDYFIYQHYAPPCMKSKLSYATDERQAKTDPLMYTGDENMIWFSKVLPLQVETLSSFLAEHKEFLVFSQHPAGSWQGGWLLPEIVKGEHSFQLVSEKHYDTFTGPITLYRVRHD